MNERDRKLDDARAILAHAHAPVTPEVRADLDRRRRVLDALVAKYPLPPGNSPRERAVIDRAIRGVLDADASLLAEMEAAL